MTNKSLNGSKPLPITLEMMFGGIREAAVMLNISEKQKVFGWMPKSLLLKQMRFKVWVHIYKTSRTFRDNATLFITWILKDMNSVIDSDWSKTTTTTLRVFKISALKIITVFSMITAISRAKHWILYHVQLVWGRKDWTYCAVSLSLPLSKQQCDRLPQDYCLLNIYWWQYHYRCLLLHILSDIINFLCMIPVFGNLTVQ